MPTCMVLQQRPHPITLPHPSSAPPLPPLTQGTGKWTIQQAAELSVAAPTMEAALDARFLSGESTVPLAVMRGTCARALSATPALCIHAEQTGIACVAVMQPAIPPQRPCLPRNNPFPFPPPSVALPGLKEERVAAEAVYAGIGVQPPAAGADGVDKQQLVADVKAALFAAKVRCWEGLAGCESHLVFAALLQYCALCFHTCATHLCG